MLASIGTLMLLHPHAAGTTCSPLANTLAPMENKATTTDVPHAGNSHPKHDSRRRPSQHKPAAAAHFSSPADTGSKVYQLPPSPLSRMTHALAGGAGASVVDRSNTMSPSNQTPRSALPQTTHASGGDSGGVIVRFGSSACDASQGALPWFSCYQMPPPSSAAPMALDPIPMLGGGVDGRESSNTTTIPRYATFLSSLDTGLASVVGLTPFSSSVDLQASSTYSSPPLLTQSTASVDFGWTDEYELPPLPPSLSGPPPMEKPTVIDLEADRPAPAYISLVDDDDDDSGKNVVQYVDLEGPGSGLNSSGHATGSTSIKASCPQLPSSSSSLLGLAPAPADAWVKKEPVDWSSWGTSQLGNNTIARSGSGSSSRGMPHPYSSGSTGLNLAPWTPTSSNSLPAPAANFGVKKEAVDRSWHTSKLGKNTITSGGSSSVRMPQPAYSSVKKDLMVVGSKQKLLSSPGTGWGSGVAGSSIQYKDDPNSPFVAKFADGSFTQNDINKIMGEKSLKDIVLRDPKRVRSILKNRITAGRSKQKKVEYLSELEHKVELLRQENKSLSANVNSLECTSISLRSEKTNMMIDLHGFEQQKQQMNELNETLNSEVHRLKLAAGEITGSHISSSSYQEMGSQMMQQQQLQAHNHQLARSNQEQRQLAYLDNILMQ